jgi:purine-cytosine permease-like protein
MNNKSIGGIMIAIVTGVILYVILMLILGAIVAALWNFTIAVAIAGVAELTWAQGAGTLILFNLLFNTISTNLKNIK